MAKILTCIFVCLFSLSAAHGGVDSETAHKQELERVKKQAAEKQAELNKYRAQEKAISKEISALESRKAEAIRQQNKLQSDINYVEQTLLSTEDKRAALERSMPMWRAVLTDEIVAHYLMPSCEVCIGGTQVEEELFLDRLLAHQAEFVVALQTENEAAKQKIYDFEARNKKLLAESSKIQQKQEVITTSFLKKQQDLSQTQKKAQAVRKEINELNKSARALDDLLAKFEKQRKEAAQKKAKSGAADQAAVKQTSIAKIDIAKHSLPWPVKGQIISQFGKEYRNDLNTWIFRDGVKIAAQAGQAVKCVYAGEVIYAGPFRSYGNVVIVDHGKGFFSIYGFLNQIQASVGNKLEQGAVLGTVGIDTQQSSGTGRYAVYFETRQGTTAVDPMDWLE